MAKSSSEIATGRATPRSPPLISSTYSANSLLGRTPRSCHSIISPARASQGRALPVRVIRYRSLHDKIGPCPQCPESDGWPSKRRRSLWATSRPTASRQNWLIDHLLARPPSPAVRCQTGIRQRKGPRLWATRASRVRPSWGMVSRNGAHPNGLRQSG